MSLLLRRILKVNQSAIVHSRWCEIRCSPVHRSVSVTPHNLLHTNERRWPVPCVSVPLHPVHQSTLHNNHQHTRGKSKKSGKHQQQQQSTHDDDTLADDADADEMADAYEEMLGDKHNRTLRVTVNSMRADLLLKAGLGVARNKVDALFYDSKIRVNGKKLLKKSAPLEVDDEIDVVRGPSPTNPDHLVVSRVEIVSVTPRTESLSVTLRRHKSLVIENYREGGVYTGADPHEK